MWSTCAQQNNSSCSGTALRRKMLFDPGAEKLRLTFTVVFAVFTLSPFLQGRWNKEDLQENALIKTPKASGQLRATQRKGWLQTFPCICYIFFPPSLNLTSQQVLLCCRLSCWCHSSLNPSDLICCLPSLPSCCLEHSPDPVQSCLSSLRQHNNSPDKK